MNFLGLTYLETSDTLLYLGAPIYRLKLGTPLALATIEHQKETSKYTVTVTFLGYINILIDLAWGDKTVSKSRKKWYIYFGDKAWKQHINPIHLIMRLCDW